MPECRCVCVPMRESVLYSTHVTHLWLCYHAWLVHCNIVCRGPRAQSKTSAPHRNPLKLFMVSSCPKSSVTVCVLYTGEPWNKAPSRAGFTSCWLSTSPEFELEGQFAFQPDTSEVKGLLIPLSHHFLFHSYMTYHSPGMSCTYLCVFEEMKHH